MIGDCNDNSYDINFCLIPTQIYNCLRLSGIKRVLECLTEYLRWQSDVVLNIRIQVKESILDYLHELVVRMEPVELVNSDVLQQLLARIVMWSQDQKCPELRRVNKSIGCLDS